MAKKSYSTRSLSKQFDPKTVAEFKTTTPSEISEVLYGAVPKTAEAEQPRPMTSHQNIMRARISDIYKTKYTSGVGASMEIKPNDNRFSPARSSQNGFIKPKDVNVDIEEPSKSEVQAMISPEENKDVASAPIIQHSKTIPEVQKI